MTKEQLLQIAYSEQRTCGMLQEEFDCLIVLIEDGYIYTLEELQKYGIGCNHHVK